jgi:hypothetical protein
MAEPIWNQFLTERDKAVFAAAGYGARAGFRHRPVLLVIDVNYNFCGDRREPIMESIKRWRNSCGAEAYLGDRHDKYADVLKVEEVKRYLASLPKGLFDLPRGVPSQV